MKLFFVLLVTSAYSLHVNAQNTSIFKSKPWEDYKQKQLLKVLKDSLRGRFSLPQNTYNIPQQNKMSVFKIPLQGIYAGSTAKGDIYTMLTDNMPCLVPGKEFTYNMPVAGSFNADKSVLPILIKPADKNPLDLNKGSQEK